MKKLSNTEAEFKKSVAYKKKPVLTPGRAIMVRPVALRISSIYYQILSIAMPIKIPIKMEAFQTDLNYNVFC